jgi:hypothetical protein
MAITNQFLRLVIGIKAEFCGFKRSVVGSKSYEHFMMLLQHRDFHFEILKKITFMKTSKNLC